MLGILPLIIRRFVSKFALQGRMRFPPFMKHLFLFFALLQSLSAATYYVSLNGDDARAGLTPATAWRSVAKVNSTRFSPGDEVRFQKGGVWFEALKPGSSGEVGKPVTFTSYGDGSAPVFDGSDEVDLASASLFDTGGEVYAVLVDGGFLRPSLDWKLNGSSVTLTKPVAPGAKVRFVRRENLVNIQSLKHIVLRGLAVNATAKMHGGYGFRIEMSEDILLEDCVAARGGKHHFGLINSTRVVLRRCHASHVMPDQGGGGASAFVSYSDKRRHGDTSRYEDCVVEDYRDATERGQYPAFVTHGEGIGEVVISGLNSKGAGVNFNNRESGATLSLINSSIEDADISLYGKGSVLEKVTLTRGVLKLDGVANEVRQCRLLGLNPGFKGYQAAIVNTGTSNVISDTEVTLDAEAKPFNAALAIVNPHSALTWKKCRFTTPACVVKVQFSDLKAAYCTAQSNSYPSTATFILKETVKPLTLVDWQALGLDEK